MTPLSLLIRRKIEDAGPISVADYMALALAHPEFGYYTRSQPEERGPIGRKGDFVTSPEISQVFGELLAAWFVTVWRSMGAPRPIHLAELGPGRGTLLADMWRAVTAIAPDFAHALNFHLVETSASLRACQQTTFAALSTPPPHHWHDRLDDLPRGPLLLVANEFLDALPVEQYVADAGIWRQRQVAIDSAGNGFVFALGEAVDLLRRPELAGLPDAVHGTLVERCPEAERLVARLAARLAAEGGIALFIDYGPTRSAVGETLQAIRGHRRIHPLADAGDVDLSHHVDFERLANTAVAAGGRAWGPIPQGLFLARLGIAERARALEAASPARGDAIGGAIRRLVHPGRMGLLFKVLAVGHPALPAPPAFLTDGSAI